MVAPPEPPNGALASRLWPEARTVAGYDPRRAIELAEAPAHPWDGDDGGSALYRDIMEHTPPSERWFAADAGLTTNAHETHHGLQHAVSQTREEHHFVYFGDGVGAFVPEPKTGLRPLRTNADGTVVYTIDAHTATPHVVARLPARVAELARTRTKTYLLAPGRQTYGVISLLNEWNAYLASARIGLELHAVGYYDGYRTATSFRRTDLMTGPVDFLYFVTAGIAALAEREPDYLAQRGGQLAAVYALFAEETIELVRASRAIDVFKGFHEDELLAHFVSSDDNRGLRQFLIEWLGADFTRRVFDF